ncbi:MAG: hypothetical protein IJ614_00280 [Prevotella sp.]|nr:hypothetical protein [Prevotella sp.]
MKRKYSAPAMRTYALNQSNSILAGSALGSEIKGDANSSYETLSPGFEFILED